MHLSLLLYFWNKEEFLKKFFEKISWCTLPKHRTLSHLYFLLKKADILLWCSIMFMCNLYQGVTNVSSISQMKTQRRKKTALIVPLHKDFLMDCCCWVLGHFCFIRFVCILMQLWFHCKWMNLYLICVTIE